MILADLEREYEAAIVARRVTESIGFRAEPSWQECEDEVRRISALLDAAYEAEEKNQR